MDRNMSLSKKIVNKYNLPTPYVLWVNHVIVHEHNMICGHPGNRPLLREYDDDNECVPFFSGDPSEE